MEFCFGGMKCQHPAMTDVTDPTSDPYFYAAESGRVVASFGAEEVTWLRAAARGFYRKYVSRTEKNELWPHRPFVWSRAEIIRDRARSMATFDLHTGVESRRHGLYGRRDSLHHFERRRIEL